MNGIGAFTTEVVEELTYSFHPSMRNGPSPDTMPSSTTNLVAP
jgi:hypothetical protein